MRNPHLGPILYDDCPKEIEESLALLSILEEFYLFITSGEMKNLRKTIEAFCFYSQTLLKGEPFPSSLQKMGRFLMMIECNQSIASREWKELFHSFFLELFPFFQRMKQNENLLFYLLEHRIPFNAFLGEKMVEKLLLRLFPEGKSSIRNILFQEYEKRGFSFMIEKSERLLQDVIL
jgi:hypothetical protein